MRLRLPGTRVLLWSAIAFFAVAVGLAANLLIKRAERDALSAASSRAEHFVSSSEASLNRTLLSIDMLLAGADTLLEPALKPDGSWNSALADRLLMDTLRRGLFASDLLVMAEDRQVLAAAQPYARRMGLSAPASFVASMWKRAGAPMAISVPTANVATAERVIYFARLVRMTNSRTVLVMAEVPVSLISSPLSQASHFPGMLVTLETDEGHLITSVPPKEHLLDRKISPPLNEGVALGEAQRAPSRLGGAPAIVVARPTIYRSLFVAASVPLDSALSGWLDDRRDIIRASGLFIVMLLAFGAVGELRQSRHRIQVQNTELRRLASRDSLTGCFNRRAFFEQAGELFAQAKAQESSFCCFMADIDHFKQFNDIYGHAVGDQVIQVVAKALTVGLRMPDVLCRYGGEEFCIALPSTSLENAMAVAERIRANIEARASQGMRDISGKPITASFGVASLDTGANTLEDLINQADQALYLSKKNGRNQVTAWSGQA